MKKFCAEFGEDRWLESNIEMPKGGFFVDIGCAWPFLYSTSAFLRQRGWESCNIDGNPFYEPLWAGVALFTNCVIGDGNPVLFQTGGIPELSHVGEGELTPTVRLDALLAHSPSVDAIFCDLEGHEFEALKTFDWKKNHPQVIVSEYSTWTPQGVVDDFRVKEMLEAMGYSERHRTKANIIFTK